MCFDQTLFFRSSFLSGNNDVGRNQVCPVCPVPHPCVHGMMMVNKNPTAGNDGEIKRNKTPGRKTLPVHMPCPVTAVTLLLPDTDQVFQNSPTLSKPPSSPPPWLPLEVKGAMCFQLRFQPPPLRFTKKRGENESLTCIHVFLQAADTGISSGAFGWVHLDVCKEVQGRKQELDA